MYNTNTNFIIIVLTLAFLSNSIHIHAKAIKHRRLSKRELSNDIVTEEPEVLIRVEERVYKHLCGSRLKDAILKLCVEGLNTPNEAVNESRSARTARDIVQRIPRQVTKECCYRACLESTLLTYCKPFTRRNTTTTTTTENPNGQPFMESNSVDLENQIREETLDKTQIQPETTPQEDEGDNNETQGGRDQSDYNVIAIDRETNDAYIY